MTRKIALTSNGPLSGKSTLAKHLEKEYGFIRADHSLTLVTDFVDIWNDPLPYSEHITVEQVYKEKEQWRLLLQQFGNVMGYNGGPGVRNLTGVRNLIVRTLVQAGCSITQARCPGHKPVVCPNKNVVYDSFRGESQAQAMRELGFELVQINLAGEDRCARALALSRSCSDIEMSMITAPELELGIRQPDVMLLGELPVEVLGQVLMHRAEGAQIQIFGNRA